MAKDKKYQGNKGLEYYKAYPRDFFEGVLGMDGPLRGFYRMTIDLIYMHDGFLLDDWSHIAGHTGFGITKCKRFMADLITRGKIEVEKTDDSNYFVNPRSKVELSASRKFQSKQANNVAKRWNNNNLADQVEIPQAIPPQDHNTTRQSPADSKRNSGLSPLFGGDQKKKAKPKPKQDEARDQLIEFASPEAVDEYLKYRKGSKAKGTTKRAALLIAKQLEIIKDQDGDTDEALDMAQVQGWQGLRADWYFNKKGQDDGNGNSNNGATSNNRGMARPTKASEIADRAARYAASRKAGG